MDSKKCVVVSNIQASVAPDIIQAFFGHVGPVVSARTLSFDPVSCTKQFLVQFETPAQASAALALSGILLLEKPVLVTPGDSCAPRPSSTSSTGGKSEVEETTSAAAEITAKAKTEDPDAMLHTQKAEDVSRTIYVGNVASSVTQQQLTDFFSSSCGAVNFAHIAGDDSRATRFAFVEFATKEGASVALATMGGRILQDRAVRVLQSNTPIVRPSPRMCDIVRQRQEQEKLRAAVALINRKVGEEEKEKSKSKSHSRSRSRSRSRHHHHHHHHSYHRHKSKSRSRSRSPHKSSHHRHRSRSKSKK